MSGAQIFSACGIPVVAQQFVDTSVQLRGKTGQAIVEVSPRIVPVELGRLCRPPNYAEWLRFSPDLRGVPSEKLLL